MNVNEIPGKESCPHFGEAGPRTKTSRLKYHVRALYISLYTVYIFFRTTQSEINDQSTLHSKIHDDTTHHNKIDHQR